MNLNLKEFSEKYNLNECIQCGKCTGGCPVALRTNLNIRRMVYDSKITDMLEPLAQAVEIWDCTACNTCTSRCPKGLKPFELMVGLREIFIKQGKIQPTVQEALESIYQVGNPWYKPRNRRSEWMQGLNVNIAKPKQHVENLIFVCCTIAYDSEVQFIAKNLVKVLNKAKVDYGFIGDEETCCAGEAYNLGEKGLFQIIRENNEQLLNSYNCKRIVTISPHCYSTFCNQYQNLKVEVVHYTHLLKELIDSNTVKLVRSLPESIVYHDPCFLGKQNNVYEEPRYLLSKIPGAKLLEFERRKERSLCCEGGGGKMWVDSESVKERLAEIRVRDAKELCANLIAVACPFCYFTLNDALITTGLSNEIRVTDILGILPDLIE